MSQDPKQNDIQLAAAPSGACAFGHRDVVTAPCWDGQTATVDYVKDLGLESGPTAFFVEGGWWRANDLTLVFRPTTARGPEARDASNQAVVERPSGAEEER